MDQKKRRGVGIIRTAGNYEIEESFKERLSSAECFQIVEEKEQRQRPTKINPWNLPFESCGFRFIPKEEILNDGISGSVIGFFLRKGKFGGISQIPL